MREASAPPDAVTSTARDVRNSLRDRQRRGSSSPDRARANSRATAHLRASGPVARPLWRRRAVRSPRPVIVKPGVRPARRLLLGQLVAAFGLDDLPRLGELAQRGARGAAGDPGRLGDVAGCLGAVLERVEDLRARVTARRRRARPSPPGRGGSRRWLRSRRRLGRRGLGLRASAAHARADAAFEATERVAQALELVAEIAVLPQLLLDLSDPCLDLLNDRAHTRYLGHCSPLMVALDRILGQ